MCLISNYALFANLILFSNTISFQYSSLESIKDTFSTMSEIKGYEPYTAFWELLEPARVVVISVEYWFIGAPAEV